VYNVGGGSRVSINAVLDLIARITGRELRIRREPAQKGDMRDTYADTSRALADLGFAPSATLAEGLRAEFDWLSGISTSA
jgi:UDP-glucose 4-epimerase